MLVAGPAGGPLDLRADTLIRVLAHGLPEGTAVRRNSIGGPDGVTGCNQFEARIAPDGNTVLMLPGAAMLAWLVGDPRARFDAGRFIPVLAGTAPGVLVSRRPLGNDGAATVLRVAAARPDSADLSTLLALDLLGIRARPVFGLSDAAADAALAARAVDAVLLLGPNAPRRAERLAHDGAQPVLSLGAPGDDGTVLRHPAFPDVPTLQEVFMSEHGRPPTGELYEAWQAVAASAQLTFMLALLSPSPAALVALWRQAATQAAPLGAGTDVRLIASPAVNGFAAPLAADVGALFALRRWLADRLNWQPA